ncbi:MAG: hypothetical protein HYV60_25335, partial [Planctomycetia bacterium]|nr:hypothetical protein [Planctomycetia bacterium]
PQRRPWFQFELRTLLVLVLIIAALLTPYTWKAARERRELRKFQSAQAIDSTIGRDGTRGKALFSPELGPYRFQFAKLPPGVGSNALENIARLEHCEEVILRAVEMADADLHYILSLQGMRSLDLTATDITDKGLPKLTRFRALEELILDHTCISDNSINVLTSLPRLRKISVCGTHLSQEGVKKLEARKIHVTWATAPSEDSRKVAVELERHGMPVELRRSPSHQTSYFLTVIARSWPPREELASPTLAWSLKTGARLPTSDLAFSLNGRSLEPQEYALLAGYQGLKQLTFNGARFYKSAENLSQLNNVEALAFNKCLISNQQLAHISALARLERLEIDNPEMYIEGKRYECVSDHGLVHLQKLWKLHTLALRNINFPLSQYVLEQTAKSGQSIDELCLTDAGLDHLTALENLRSLDLSGNALTPAGLMKLTRLSNLRELILADIPLTPQEKSELKEAFPGTRLVFADAE